MPVIGFCNAHPKAAENKPNPMPNPAHEPEYEEIANRTKINKKIYFSTLENISIFEICLFLLTLFRRPFFIADITKLKTIKTTTTVIIVLKIGIYLDKSLTGANKFAILG